MWRVIQWKPIANVRIEEMSAEESKPVSMWNDDRHEWDFEEVKEGMRSLSAGEADI